MAIVTKESKVLTFKAGSQEWLDCRRKYLTGTEVGCLFKGCGFKSWTKILEEKIEPLPPYDNPFMKIGRILEPAVLNAFKINMGISAKPVGSDDEVVMVVRESPPLSCSLDGITDDGIIVEAKTTGSKDYDKAVENIRKWEAGVPKQYLSQVHAQLILTETEIAYVGVLGYVYPLPFIAYEVRTTDEIREMILFAVDSFWDTLVNEAEYRVTEKIIEDYKKAIDSSARLLYNSYKEGN